MNHVLLTCVGVSIAICAVLASAYYYSPTTYEPYYWEQPSDWAEGSEHELNLLENNHE